jgi:hypothetical protein
MGDTVISKLHGTLKVLLGEVNPFRNSRIMVGNVDFGVRQAWI